MNYFVRIVWRNFMNTINLEECGYGDYFKSQENDIRKEERELIAARITEVHKEQYKIICSLGEYSAKLKGSFLYSVTDLSLIHI